MTWWVKAWAWLRNHWYIPVAVVGLIVAFLGGGFATRALRRPDKTIRRELAASKAGTEAAAVAVERGKEAAVVALEETHRETIEAFDDAQKAKLDRLRGSPDAAARWLTRLSG